MSRTQFSWLFIAILLACTWASAQSTETVLYSFGAYLNDGVAPSGGLLFDALGNIYGTTELGGSFCQSSGGCGTVYELSPSGNGWTETILYNFCVTSNQFTCPDGAQPYAGLISDSSGNLYGTTFYGGVGNGTVFELSPPQAPGGTWSETVLWTFKGGSADGVGPYAGKLYMDVSGNIYGTTIGGGPDDMGVVFQLSPASGGSYTFSILHSFSGPDGAYPEYGIAIDKSGTLFGTTKNGGTENCGGGTVGCGLVYKLTPTTGGKWTETVLYRFNGTTGAYPISPIAVDQTGNLYGTFLLGGDNGCDVTCGGVFKLVAGSGGGGKEYHFFFDGLAGGGNPETGVLLDKKSGAMFGTTSDGGPGNVFMLKGQTETVLYTFCSLPNCADGRDPNYGDLVGRAGKLYGVAVNGGQYASGVVYRISK
jgi:uncharacterized repeat protein (TIGR03803 family)